MILTAENYFSKEANLEYMSVSQFKAFSKCQHSALAEIKGKYQREQTTALLVGSFVDAYFEGEDAIVKFVNAHPEIFTKDKRLKADFVKANEIIKRIEKDRLFMKYLSGEKQVIMTGQICGVAVKIKIDSYHPDKIVDLKIMANFEDQKDEERGLLPWWEFWGYDKQGAVYQEVVRQNIGKRLPFFLAAATKEKITDIDIVEIEQIHLDYAMEKIKQDIEFYDAIKKGIIKPERCEQCEYCKTTKRLRKPTKSNEFYLI
jgi:hypothetical protein